MRVVRRADTHMETTVHRDLAMQDSKRMRDSEHRNSSATELLLELELHYEFMNYAAGGNSVLG